MSDSISGWKSPQSPSEKNPESISSIVSRNSGLESYARSILDESGQGAFVVGLHGLPIALEVGGSGQRLQALELIFQMRYPSVADVSRDERAQLWIAQRDPAPWRYSVCHVEV